MTTSAPRQQRNGDRRAAHSGASDGSHGGLLAMGSDGGSISARGTLRRSKAPTDKKPRGMRGRMPLRTNPGSGVGPLWRYRFIDRSPDRLHRRPILSPSPERLTAPYHSIA